MTKSQNLRVEIGVISLSQRSLTLLVAIISMALIAPLAITTQVGASDNSAHDRDWEVWALDQGSGINRVHVFAHEDGEFVEVERFAFGDLEAPHNEVQTPHMIDFDDSNRYAAIASTASGTVSIVRTADYEVIETIETGATAHMALWAPAPDNSIWVANIGSKSFTQIVADLDNETFEIGQDIPVSQRLLDEDWPGWVDAYGDDIDNWPGAVCHEFTPDGQYAYLTMGPMDGGLVVIDLESGEIVQAFDPSEVRANCGLAFSPNHDQMYANWSGHLSGLDHVDHAEPGEWYVFDIDTHKLAGTYSSEVAGVRGIDPHGQRVSPDGTEMWQVNRVSHDGIVVDTATQEVIDTIELVDTPDIIGFSPDGAWLFVTLRGPNPASMPHVAEGQTPGVEVFDVAARESVAVLQPFSDDEADASDFHGINVRGPVTTSDDDSDEPAAESGASLTDDDTADLVPATGSERDLALIAMLAAVVAGSATLAVGLGLRSRLIPARASRR
jgi:DNA-binding beta-propeller fold protein YncE